MRHHEETMDLPVPGAGVGLLAGLTAGVLIGAGLAYLLDPQRGRTRRAMMRDRAFSAARQSRRRAERHGRRIRDQAQGAAAEARRAFTPDDADDLTINERVRAALGRVVTHVHAVQTDVYGGVLTLCGPILAHEVPEVMRTVVNVRGVRDVINELEPHPTAEGVPALQG